MIVRRHSSEKLNKNTLFYHSPTEIIHCSQNQLIVKLRNCEITLFVHAGLFLDMSLLMYNRLYQSVQQSVCLSVFRSVSHTRKPANINRFLASFMTNFISSVILSSLLSPLSSSTSSSLVARQYTVRQHTVRRTAGL